MSRLLAGTSKRRMHTVGAGALIGGAFLVFGMAPIHNAAAQSGDGSGGAIAKPDCPTTVVETTTTEAPTTEAPTTEAPTTEAPTTTVVETTSTAEVLPPVETTTPQTAPETAPASAAPTTAAVSPATLPTTGSGSAGIAGLGAALMAGGALSLVVAERRRHADHS